MKRKEQDDKPPLRKTLVALPEDLWLAARTKALQERRFLKDIVADALTMYLKLKKK